MVKCRSRNRFTVSQFLSHCCLSLCSFVAGFIVPGRSLLGHVGVLKTVSKSRPLAGIQRGGREDGDSLKGGKGQAKMAFESLRLVDF